MVVIGLGLLTTACKKEEEPTTGEPIKELRLLGSAVPSSNFQNNGTFSMNLLAIDANDEVIQLTGNNVSMVLDSVVSAKPQYTLTVKDVSYIPISTTGKIKVALLLDSSGSMEDNDPNYLRKDASGNFIRLLLQNSPSHKAGIFDFAGGSGDANGDGIDDYYLRVLQDFTYVTDTTHLFPALDSVTAWGGTPLYLSLWYLLDYVHNHLDSGYGHAILVLTDGEDNESGYITSDSVINKSKNYKIPIFAVGLGDTSYVDFTELQRMANETGGAYANASDANGLNFIFNSMGFGISQGYTKVTASISPIPPSGSRIYGKIRVTSGGTIKVSNWYFMAP